MATSTTSFSNTPQAAADTYGYSEGSFEATGYLILDVMANDLGGAAKVLYSVDDGWGSTQADLLQSDLTNPATYSDGCTARGAQLTIVDGKVKLQGTTDYMAMINALPSGQTLTDSFTYAIKLANGTMSWTTVQLTFTGTNDGPVAVADTATTAEDAPLTIDVLANDTDVDAGAMLTVTGASVPSGQGTASVLDNKVVFNPGSDFDHLKQGATATVTVNYAIKDEFGATSTSTVTVTVTGTNDIPVAVADTGTTAENAPLTIDVLANDTDIDDGHVFTLTGGATATPGQGSVSVVGNKLVFDPGTRFDHLAVGDTATVTVNYTMEDEFGATSASTLTITVTGTNDGPVAAADTASSTENQALTIDVLANDTDADDGAVLTVTAASTAAGQGSASVAGNQVTFDPGSDFDYLAGGQEATVEVSYTIEDDQGASATSKVIVTVTGTNDGPTATNLNVAESYTEDVALDLANIVVVDVDSTSVTATLTLSDAAAGALSTGTFGTATSSYDATTGTWSVTGSGADVTAALASVSFNPADNFNGNFTIASSVSDGVAPALTGSKSVTGTPVEDEATGTLAFTGTVQQGATLTADISGITDVDGAITASYQWQVFDGTNWNNIAGATASTFGIPNDSTYVGKQIRLTATSSDPNLGTTPFASAGQAVASIAPPPVANADLFYASDNTAGVSIGFDVLLTNDTDLAGADIASVAVVTQGALTAGSLAVDTTARALTLTTGNSLSAITLEYTLTSGQKGTVTVNIIDIGTGASADNISSQLTGAYAGSFINLANGDDTAVSGSTNGAYDIFLGGPGNDTLNGGTGPDKITGDGGNDSITGGAGNDTLTGDSGVDTFVFNTALASAGVDVITDFNAGAGPQHEFIRLDDAFFTGLSATAGVLDASSFVVYNAGTYGTTTTASKIVFDAANGNLYYDANGSTGGLADAVQFARLTGVLTDVDAADFNIF